MLKLARRIARDVLAPRGIYVARAEGLTYWRHALRLREVLGDLRIETVLDVGGNRGAFRDLLRRDIRFEGRILSFEPIPALAAGLAGRAAADPGWQVIGHALGREEGETMLNVTADPAYSSLLAPLDGSPPETAVERVEPVRVRRLDNALADFAPRDGLGRLFLKMDTQGYDLEVFAGATGVLERIHGLQSELSVRPLYAGMPDYRAAIAAYEAAGFALAELTTIHLADQLAVELDCIMIRPIAAR